MKQFFCVCLLTLFSAFPARAAELAGVTMPDTITVSARELKLNGQGLRTKVFFKIYVAGLYLESPTHDGARAIAADEVKRVVMHFLYKKVSREQMVEAWQEGFEKNSPSEMPKLKSEIGRFCSFMTDIQSGQEVVLTYEPGSGTTVELAGQTKGTIPGVPFMQALLRQWLGDHPPSQDLKEGLLGKPH
jgi:hypothetical protein